MIDLRGFRGWAAPTEQPFLCLWRQGKVSCRALERWLVQEMYLYQAMLGLQTSLLRRAPQRHRLIMINALLFTVEELDWLASLELSRLPAHPVRQRYLDFLQGLEQAPYAIGIVANWARHRVFFDAWSSLLPDDEEMEGLSGLADEITQHWMAPEAQALIHDFGSLALEASSELSPEEVDRVVGQVLQLEQSAWEMALEFALEDISDRGKEH
ncbi:hypothetical protein [Meiothermus sp. CFH 77666]|uniref:hypothetical protein n=1 Tax=Meiothermus sp. CFH 77666 TaxID=2817942 RepID=UPI001AA04531|nr:hypothetical protein [Meiothermus sp. CFH 77666]MBO1435818.1 hypothetical protein [Meiothermus sp. CFH 77666]